MAFGFRPLALARAESLESRADTLTGVRPNSSADEGRHQSLTELVGNWTLIEGKRLETHAHPRRAPFERLDADNLDWSKHAQRHSRVVLHRRADFVDRPDDAVQVLRVGDLHVHDRVRELLTEIRERRHASVGEDL